MISFINKIIYNAFDLGGSKLILVFFLIMLSTIIELLGISLIIPIISSFLDPSYSNQLQTLDKIRFTENINSLNFFLILFFLLFILKYLITILFEYVIVRVTKNWEISLAIKLIDQYLRRSWIETVKNQDVLIKNIVTDIPTFIIQGVSGVLNIIKCLLILSAIFLYLIYEKGIIVLIFFSIIVFFFYFFLSYFKNFLFNTSKNFGKFMKTKFDLTSEIKEGNREIKIYNLKNYFLNEYLFNEKKIVSVEVVKKMLQILPKIGIELICIAIFIVFISYNSEDPKQVIPFLGLLTFIVYRSQPLIASLTSLTAALQVHRTQIYEGIKIIENTKIEEKRNIQQANEDPIDFGKNPKINIQNLTFSYLEEEKLKPIFSNLNLQLQFGKIYGLAGKNGSGKSTFADLLIGLLKPKEGQILINDKNINTFPNNWINIVSYLSQNYFLFNDTIKNNITLQQRQNKTFDSKKYDKAIRISNLINEFEKFSNKDETKLNNSGRNLSGGQKQRIAIARLIYKSSKIIILDEPTASLDQISSDLMIKMLQEIKKDKLILIISHSQEILNKCDEMLSIDHFGIKKTN